MFFVYIYFPSPKYTNSGMETAYFEASVLVRFEEIHLASVIEMYKQFTFAEILYVCDPFLVVFHFCNLSWTRRYIRNVRQLYVTTY